MDESTSTITSPYYPNDYTNYLNCTWVISVNRDSRVILIFDEFITDSHYDFVQVFDGNSVQSKSIGKFWGSESKNLISSSNSLTVQFRTDATSVKKGFAAKYKIKPYGK